MRCYESAYGGQKRQTVFAELHAAHAVDRTHFIAGDGKAAGYIVQGFIRLLLAGAQRMIAEDFVQRIGQLRGMGRNCTICFQRACSSFWRRLLPYRTTRLYDAIFRNGGEDLILARQF